jgi:hypothetical protein
MDIIIAVKADVGGSSGEERGDGGTTAEGREDQFHGVPANPLKAAISHAAKLSLPAYFERVGWPLNKALPRGEAFSSGDLGMIVREHQLVKLQVSQKLLNYKKERYGFNQAAVILSSTDLKERIHGAMSMSSMAFVTQTLGQICSPGDPSYGSDFNNLCAALGAQPIVARTFVKLLAGSPDNNCLMLLIDVVGHWIQKLSEAFPRTAAGIQHAQIDFDRARELKLKSFIADFMEEYDASGLPRAKVSRIAFGHLSWFLHHVMYMVWLHSVCDHDKPPVKFPDDCLVGKHARPIIYYVAGWTLYSTSKALTVARVKRLLFFKFSESQSIKEDMAKSKDLSTLLVDRRKHKSPVLLA